MSSLIAFVFGLVTGSFLNVCIYRLPRFESIVFPPSHCPHCQKEISCRDNIPILSFILLGGRCRNCGGKISVQYPLVEAITGFFSWFIFLHSADVIEYLISFAFVSALIVVFVIDLKHQIIPDVVSLPFIVVGFLSSFLTDRVSWVDSLVGIAVGGALVFLTALVYYLLTRKEGMGGGDLKLMGMIGAFLGWKGAVFSFAGGSFLGAGAGVLMMLLKGWKGKDSIPFGPFLSLSALIYLLWGDEIITWYFSSLRGEGGF